VSETKWKEKYFELKKEIEENLPKRIAWTRADERQQTISEVREWLKKEVDWYCECSNDQPTANIDAFLMKFDKKFRVSETGLEKTAWARRLKQKFGVKP